MYNARRIITQTNPTNTSISPHGERRWLLFRCGENASDLLAAAFKYTALLSITVTIRPSELGPLASFPLPFHPRCPLFQIQFLDFRALWDVGKLNLSLKLAAPLFFWTFRALPVLEAAALGEGTR